MRVSPARLLLRPAPRLLPHACGRTSPAFSGFPRRWQSSASSSAAAAATLTDEAALLFKLTGRDQLGVVRARLPPLAPADLRLTASVAAGVGLR